HSLVYRKYLKEAAVVNAMVAVADTFVDGIANLPSLSRAAQDVVHSISEGRDNFQSVARVVDSDPVLAATILKVSNSAFYASPTRVGSVSVAISRLGLNEVRALVCTASLMRDFRDASGTIDLAKFWTHSLSTAVACHVIVQPGGARPGALLGDNPFYLSGLMHHLGILVEAIHMPLKFTQACVLARERGWSLEQAEREVFGFGHSACAAALLDRWKMPPQIRDAALYHLEPEACPGDARAARVVHLAGLLTHELGSESYEMVAPWMSEDAFHGLGWSLDRLPELQQRIREAIADAQQLQLALAGA
ncbi:MAG TPA: HDOD domain-containing protein, partial [bacterium]|nr:HDOD domain-containing protein [bacterium]